MNIAGIFWFAGRSLGRSWGISLDIGGDFTGSVSAVMNTLGNIGGGLSAVIIGYLATNLGWNWPFLVPSAMCAIAALLSATINPNRSAVEYHEGNTENG